MVKKTITYTDYNGVERKEDFYFNFKKSEILEMEMGTQGGLAEKIQKVIDSKDQVEIINIFKDLVLKAYGVKSDDGKRFIKSPELSKEFTETEAYSEIFMELAMDADAAAAFVKGIIPEEKPSVPAPKDK